MNIYYTIYYNSLQSHFLISMTSEYGWFAALQFGGYNMTLATLAAFAGSVLGLSVTYGMGFYVSRWRENIPIYNEGVYNRIAGLFNRKLYKLMAIPPILILEMIPGFTLFVLINGLFRVPPGKAIAAIACSRILYYAFYLLQ